MAGQVANDGCVQVDRQHRRRACAVYVWRHNPRARLRSGPLLAKNELAINNLAKLVPHRLPESQN